MNTGPDAVATDATDRPDVELALTVVRHADGPDRCTVHPPDATGDARLSTWLSADYGAVVDLAAMQ